MVRKILAISAAGALLLMMVPAVTSAADCTGRYPSTGTTPPCDTAVTFTVDGGTTLFAPASIDLGHGIPGVKVTTNGLFVDYVTNTAGQHLTLASSALTWDDGTTTWTIPNTDLFFGGSGSSTDLSAARQVGAMSANTGNNYDTVGAFSVTVYVPSVAANTGGTHYAGTFTFGVN